MKTWIKRGLILLVISGILAGSISAYIWWPITAGPYAQPSKWKLVFADEFDGTTLNLTSWSYNYPENSYNSGHTHNHEGYMAAENVIVQDGLLRLKGENRRHPDAPAPEESPWGWLDYNYTTGAITSYGKFNLTYGYIEGRFRMPASRGFWPAFWLLNTDGPWPPEIDVLETLMHEPTTLHVTYHYSTPTDNHVMEGEAIKDLPDLSADFHTYAVEWSPNTISWYFDGKRIGTPVYNKAGIAQSQDMYLLINLAIGGWEDLPDNTTIWPAYYDCDWVRIYQQI